MSDVDQSFMTIVPLVSEDAGVTLSSMGTLFQLSRCYDSNGWRTLLDDGSLSPCLVDLIAFALPGTILLLLIPFEYYSLWTTDSKPAAVPLSFRIKMVCMRSVRIKID